MTMNETHEPVRGERERIERVYSEWERHHPPERYSLQEPGNLFIVQERERALLRLLRRHGMHRLGGRAILEVGCGAGGELRNMVRYGASPERVQGVDIQTARIEEARRLSPNIRFLVGSAEALPFADASFDLVMQFTMFSSMNDTLLRQRAAREMLRVLRPGGIILWYDMRYPSPRNREVRSIGRRELRSLFPGCSIDSISVTLLPPLARMLAPLSWTACQVLAWLPFLRSHYLAVIRSSKE